MKKHYSLRSIFVLTAMLLVLQACSDSSQTPSLSTTPNQGASTPAAVEADNNSETSADDSDMPKIEWDTVTLKNDSGKTMIRSVSAPYGKHLSFAIVSSKGTVVIADPNNIPYPKGHLKADAITTTFINHDHRDEKFLLYNPDARVSEMKAESFTVKDIQITGIPASHDGQPVDPENPTDVIYLYEVDGIRIAYFAGVDQQELTADQLKQLGRIDIALVSFFDSPVWHVKKEVSILILKALSPRIVLPTELKDEVAEEIKKAANLTDGGSSESLTISPADLAAMKGTTSIFLEPIKMS